MRIRCPKCQVELVLPDEAQGVPVCCPSCRTVFDAPLATVSEPTLPAMPKVNVVRLDVPPAERPATPAFPPVATDPDVPDLDSEERRRQRRDVLAAAGRA